MMQRIFLFALLCVVYVRCLPSAEVIELQDASDELVEGDFRDPFWGILGSAAKGACKAGMGSMCGDQKTKNDPFWNNLWKGAKNFACKNVGKSGCKTLGNAIGGKKDEVKARKPLTSQTKIKLEDASDDPSDVEDALKKVSNKAGAICKRAVKRVCASQKLRRGDSIAGRLTSSIFCKRTAPIACSKLADVVKPKLPRFSFKRLRSKLVSLAKGASQALKTAAARLMPRRKKKVPQGDEAVHDYLDDLFAVEMDETTPAVADDAAHQDEIDLISDDEMALDEETAKKELRSVLYSVIRDNIANDFKKFAPASEKSGEVSDSSSDSGDFTENLKQAIMDEIESDKVRDEIENIDMDEK